MFRVLQTTLLLAATAILGVEGRKDPDDFPMYQYEAIDVIRYLNNGNVYGEVYLKYHSCV
jgi:hypothetical protein